MDNSSTTPPSSVQIETRPPRLFTAAAAFVVNACGILLFIPVFVAILTVSLMKIGPLTFTIPAFALLLTAYCLPLGLGNAYVTRLVRSLSSEHGADSDSFIVQLTLSPRVRSGIRGVLEDADDIGRLTFAESRLEFRGDAITLTVPLGEIREIRPHNIGMRGLFVYGRRITIVVPALPNINSLEFAERSSWVLPTSRKTTRRLYERFKGKQG